MSNNGHWVGPKASPYLYFGFIYQISDLTTSRKYIGKKQFWASKSERGCKSRSTDRQSDKWRCRCWKESSWRDYKGSSQELWKWMEEYPDHEYEFRILYQCRSKASLHYSELRELWRRDVLTATLADGSYEYFNRSIGSIRFRPPKFERQGDNY